MYDEPIVEEYDEICEGETTRGNASEPPAQAGERDHALGHGLDGKAGHLMVGGGGPLASESQISFDRQLEESRTGSEEDLLSTQTRKIERTKI